MKRWGRRKGRRRVCAAVLALDIALAAALGLAFFLDQSRDAAQREALARDVGAAGVLDAAEREELYAQAAGEALGYVTLRSQISAREGTLYLDLSNDARSGYAVCVEIVLVQSGETIARTDRIEPGYFLQTLDMEAGLAPGSYHCLARCAFYAANGGAYLGSAARQVSLEVEQE